MTESRRFFQTKQAKLINAWCKTFRIYHCKFKWDLKSDYFNFAQIIKCNYRQELKLDKSVNLSQHNGNISRYAANHNFSLCKFHPLKCYFWGRFNLIIVSEPIKLNRGLFKKSRACVRYNQKSAWKSSKRAQLWIFTPDYSKQLGHSMYFWRVSWSVRYFIS